MLSEVTALRSCTKVNILVTSRDIPEISSQFNGVSKRVRADDRDMLLYINARMPHMLKHLVERSPDLEEMIREKIIKAADGM